MVAEKVRRIIFFGASVTSQGVNTQGVQAGYVEYCREILNVHFNGQLSIIKDGHVGSFFDNAGWICLADLRDKLDENTLVVSEWHSTTSPEFSPSLLKFYHEEIQSRGAKILHLVLPIKSKVGTELKSIKQTRAFTQFGSSQLNLYKCDLNLDLCLRDDQHTTEYGGREYAKIVSEAIIKIVESNVQILDQGEIIDCTKEVHAPPPPVYRYDFSSELYGGDGIEFIFDREASRNATYFQIYGKVQKGPFSPRLIIQNGNNTSFLDHWSKWTYYTHNWLTLEKLTNRECSAFEDGLRVQVSPNKPDYVALAGDSLKAIEYMNSMGSVAPKLVLGPAIYCVGSKPLSVRLFHA